MEKSSHTIQEKAEKDLKKIINWVLPIMKEVFETVEIKGFYRKHTKASIRNDEITHSISSKLKDSELRGVSLKVRYCRLYMSVIIKKTPYIITFKKNNDKNNKISYPATKNSLNHFEPTKHEGQTDWLPLYETVVANIGYANTSHDKPNQFFLTTLQDKEQIVSSLGFIKTDVEFEVEVSHIGKPSALKKKDKINKQTIISSHA